MKVRLNDKYYWEKLGRNSFDVLHEFLKLLLADWLSIVPDVVIVLVVEALHCPGSRQQVRGSDVVFHALCTEVDFQCQVLSVDGELLLALEHAILAT